MSVESRGKLGDTLNELMSRHLKVEMDPPDAATIYMADRNCVRWEAECVSGTV